MHFEARTVAGLTNILHSRATDSLPVIFYDTVPNVEIVDDDDDDDNNDDDHDEDQMHRPRSHLNHEGNRRELKLTENESNLTQFTPASQNSN